MQYRLDLVANCTAGYSAADRKTARSTAATSCSAHTMSRNLRPLPSWISWRVLSALRSRISSAATRLGCLTPLKRSRRSCVRRRRASQVASARCKSAERRSRQTRANTNIRHSTALTSGPAQRSSSELCQARANQSGSMQAAKPAAAYSGTATQRSKDRRAVDVLSRLRVMASRAPRAPKTARIRPRSDAARPA
jgi:hypothetical protein